MIGIASDRGIAGGSGGLALPDLSAGAGTPAAIGAVSGIGSNTLTAAISSLFNRAEAGAVFSAVPGDILLP